MCTLKLKRKNTSNKIAGWFFSCSTILAVSFLLVSCASFSKPTPQKQEEKSDSLIDLINAGKIAEARQRLTGAESVNQKNNKGQSLLHIAAINNDVETLTFLLALHASIEAKDNEGNTALAAAIQSQAIDTSEVLAKHNASVFIKNNTGQAVYQLAFDLGSDSLKSILNAQTLAQQDNEGNTLLHKAVLRLDSSIVKTILSVEKNVFTLNHKGESALFLAYTQAKKVESAEIAAELLLAGAEPIRGDFVYFETAIIKRNLNMRFEEGKTPLHLASEKGHIGFVDYLLARHAQVNVKNISSSTPLHEAVRNGHIECAEILLRAGADPNQRDTSGNTPLHLVMPIASRSQIFNLLLRARANPNVKDISGETPLHITARLGMSEDIIRSLIYSGADINERNKRGSTPLALAIERNQVSQAHLFVKLGADIHAEDIDQKTALTSAIKSGYDMVQAVILSENVQSRDSQGKTPLHIAIENKATSDITMYLLGLKTDVNARDKNGNSPIHIAAKNNDRVNGEILLSYGADVFTPNVAGDSALKIALTMLGGRQDWLLSSSVITASDGAGNTPLHLAAEWKLDAIVLYIVDKGGDINAKNANGETPLFNAAKVNSTATITTMLSNPLIEYTDINARDFLGNTALHACIRWGSTQAADTLLAIDAKVNTRKLVNARNLAGKTALHEASRAGNKNFMQILLAAGADINATDETGKTPLTDAIQNNQQEAVAYLLQFKASPVMQDMYGRNAFHEAVESGNTDIIALIRNSGGNAMARDSFGRSPLSLAFKQSEQAVLAVLGSNRNIVDSDGNTPLHVAVNEPGSEEVIQKLVEAGYPIDNRNRSGATALLMAVRANKEAAARFLLQAQANPFTTDSLGENAIHLILTTKKDLLPLIIESANDLADTNGDGILHYAAKIADIETIKTLLKDPAINRGQKNIAGETAYDIAVRWDRKDIASILKP